MVNRQICNINGSGNVYQQISNLHSWFIWLKNRNEKKYQRLGIGSRLMNEAEKRIKKVSAYAGIGFGVTSDYGAAKILYINRNYKPDGNGMVKNLIPVRHGDVITIEDDLVFYLTKRVMMVKSVDQMISALEHILTHSYKADMISYLHAHPEDFEEAIQLAISDKQPYAWRAAWLLWSCMEVNDLRIQAYLPKMVDCIKSKDDDHQRELFKILLQMELSEENEGMLFSECTHIWKQINKKPSVRLTAFKVMVKIGKKYPDLSQEIIYLTQDQYLDTLSQAVKKSIGKMLKAFTH